MIDIFIETIKFCLSFVTVSGRESKDAIPMYHTIFEHIYSSNTVDKDFILYQLNRKLNEAGITSESLCTALQKADMYTYPKSKILAAAVISAYERIYLNKSSDNQVSWDEAYVDLSTYGTALSLDHIMTQNPPSDDQYLKYYKLGNNLKLRPGHDFPSDQVYDGMEYNEFKSTVLHRVGNLKLKGKDSNSSRGNQSDKTFYNFAELAHRNKVISACFEQYILRMESTDSNYLPKPYEKKKRSKITGTIDFSMTGIDLTRAKPANIKILDDSVQIKTLIEILICVVKYIYKIDADRLAQMAHDGWRARRRLIICNNAKDLIYPYELLENNIYIELNLNAKNIMDYSGMLLDMFNIPRDKVTVYIPE